MSRLQLLDDRKPTWRRPDDAVVEEVIIPALQIADRFDCMVGYFGGAALRELAHGLASFIMRNDAPMRLLISPILSDTDRESVELGRPEGIERLEKAVIAAFDDEVALQSALVEHTKQCLAYLLATNRLVVKVVLVDNATFHLKEWIFGCGTDIAVLSGSANFTGQALMANVERLNLHRSWRGGDNATACADTTAEFDAYWSNAKPHAVAIDLPLALRENLVARYSTNVQPPTEADYQRAITLESRTPTQPTTGIEPSRSRPTFAPPKGLIWETGLYAHQGQAVLRWEANSRRGILAMATGAGKTITALLCAWRLWREVRHLAIIIAAPTRPLVSQWSEECAAFGLDAYVTGNDSRKKRLRSIDERLQALKFGISPVEALVVTNDFLNDPEFKSLIQTHDGAMMLIGDEVHNLGTQAFLADPPDRIKNRLGLSATPERQYDPDGTDSLTAYFGDVVFEFGLDEAIGVCLVPYEYHLHPIDLNHDELDAYRELTERIRKIYVATGGEPSSEDEDRLQLLRNRRRLILENASEKLEVLASLLEERDAGTVKHLLIYATDKDPQQLDAVNAIVRQAGLRFHQITAHETGNGALVDSVLDAFKDGSIQVLTAKRVLDEGLNVPEITEAIILASTTVERQWVQRRGRVLRTCSRIGKTHATIHDFIVLPPAGAATDDDIRRLIAGEIARCDEFTRLALNRQSLGGPLEVLQDVRLEYMI